MKEHPILFNGAMVRAVLAGVKTQTRRLDLRWLKVKAGDRIWVRETWHPCDGGPIFAADYLAEEDPKVAAGVERWYPSIHIRRDDSRIDLEATEDARAEVLEEISEADAKAEGVAPEFEVDFGAFAHGKALPASTYVLGFKHAWDRINGKRARWGSAPTVARVAFKRVRPVRDVVYL